MHVCTHTSSSFIHSLDLTLTVLKSLLSKCLHCLLVVASSSETSRDTPRGDRAGIPNSCDTNVCKTIQSYTMVSIYMCVHACTYECMCVCVYICVCEVYTQVLPRVLQECQFYLCLVGTHLCSRLGEILDVHPHLVSFSPDLSSEEEDVTQKVYQREEWNER